jgi:hypothetical protein
MVDNDNYNYNPPNCTNSDHNPVYAQFEIIKPGPVSAHVPVSAQVPVSVSASPESAQVPVSVSAAPGPSQEHEPAQESVEENEKTHEYPFEWINNGKHKTGVEKFTLKKLDNKSNDVYKIICEYYDTNKDGKIEVTTYNYTITKDDIGKIYKLTPEQKKDVLNSIETMDKLLTDRISELENVGFKDANYIYNDNERSSRKGVPLGVYIYYLEYVNFNVQAAHDLIFDLVA